MGEKSLKCEFTSKNLLLDSRFYFNLFYNIPTICNPYCVRLDALKLIVFVWLLVPLLRVARRMIFPPLLCRTDKVSSVWKGAGNILPHGASSNVSGFGNIVHRFYFSWKANLVKCIGKNFFVNFQKEHLLSW